MLKNQVECRYFPPISIHGHINKSFVMELTFFFCFFFIPVLFSFVCVLTCRDVCTCRLKLPKKWTSGSVRSDQPWRTYGTAKRLSLPRTPRPNNLMYRHASPRWVILILVLKFCLLHIVGLKDTRKIVTHPSVWEKKPICWADALDELRRS